MSKRIVDFTMEIPRGIKNIIFDLGGVFLAIDYNKTTEEFRKLGLQNFDTIYSKMQQSNLFDDFEVGEIDENTFVQNLLTHLPQNTTPNQVIDAWNAMLLHPIVENIALLNELKQNYRLFLFSNTNAIHLKAFTAILEKTPEKFNLTDYFEAIYYSHIFKMRKPNEEAFQKILDNHQLKAEETFFLDDSAQHIEGAKAIGIQAKLVETNGFFAIYTQ